MPVDHEAARRLLDTSFAAIEKKLAQNEPAPSASKSVQESCHRVFSSNTQSYRETLLGCLIARIQDRSINIRHPYVDQGTDSFSGRTMDERVVNPFLRSHKIPCSKGPYLAVFRRKIKFEKRTRSGLKDKSGFDAFLKCLSHVEGLVSEPDLMDFLAFLLFKFAELREQSRIELLRLQRLSLPQYEHLIRRLLETPSGGRFPVFLVAATFTAIKECYGLNWTVACQGINVADAASGAGGDVTVLHGDKVLLAAEITERVVDKARVVATFHTKIGPSGIEDYLFFVKGSGAPAEAIEQAHQYFAQGHEVNFLEIQNWITVMLATLGKRGRALFNTALLTCLEAEDIQRVLKVAWNDAVSSVISGQTKLPQAE
jgi:hypothetical protein